MEEKKTICPLLTATKSYLQNCLEERCAWWMPDDGCCAIATLAASAAVASEALSTEIQVVTYEGR